MNDADKLFLINEVCDVIANTTDLREEDSFGDDLVELVISICQDKFCELDLGSHVQADFVDYLQSHFAEDHDVWSFISAGFYDSSDDTEE